MKEREDQILELDAMSSCYPERVEFNVIDIEPICGTITIPFEPLQETSTIYATDNGERKEIKVKAFPPAQLRFVLPEDYPSTSAPILELECIWATHELAEKIGPVLAENSRNPGMPVLFMCCQAIVDLIRENEADLREICLDDGPYLLQNEISPAQLLKMVADASEEAEEHEFWAGIYDCEVCFESKPGSLCLRLTPCNHIFCLDCVTGQLREKTRGAHVQQATCLGIDCASPIPQPLILQLLGIEEYERYERILLESAQDQMSDVVRCPLCERHIVLSTFHRNLGVCHCGYNFCAVCLKPNHGVNECKMTSAKRKAIVESYLNATPEERLKMSSRYGGRLQSLVNDYQNEEWITGNSKRCPKCTTPIEKDKGCNKMKCTKCSTTFCWLCNKAIKNGDPYSHFREGVNYECGGRLFEGVEEDEVEEIGEDREDVDDDDGNNNAEYEVADVDDAIVIVQAWQANYAEGDFVADEHVEHVVEESTPNEEDP